ncbi:MAG TPA: 1,2-phenylacetyl-CoA epoxidase subunit PaaC [Bacteroidia bacterium]|nr:1,2-phenylacetyl-CoA epoxidase subunit PaaC [Bacteroidia bacterium]
MSNDQSALLRFVLRLGDNSLILGHRLSEWCSNGPFLEEDIAMSNIALDYLGQARILYTYAGKVEGKGHEEDFFAYERREHEFTNSLLTEMKTPDFAFAVARQLYYSTFAWLLATELQKSKDETLAGYAGKAIKEFTYHLRHANDWTLRLGDGTEESHTRMQKAIDDLWMYTGDLFATVESDAELVKNGIIPDVAALKSKWNEMIADVLERATLKMPDANAWQMEGSRTGRHTEHLGYIIAELQYVTRAYPGNKW